MKQKISAGAERRDCRPGAAPDAAQALARDRRGLRRSDRRADRERRRGARRRSREAARRVARHRDPDDRAAQARRLHVQPALSRDLPHRQGAPGSPGSRANGTSSSSNSCDRSGFPETIVQEDAEGIEHHVSAETLQAFKRHIGRAEDIRRLTQSARTSTFDAARVPIVIARSLLPRSRTLSAAASRSSTSTTSPGFNSCRSTKRRKSGS